MSESTPKPTDAKRPASKQPANAALPMAAPLESPRQTDKAKKPAASAAVIPVKSSAVIPRSSRVRELPPPPVIAPPTAKPQASELIKELRLPENLAAAEDQGAELPVELDALNIRTNAAWSSLRRRVRLPSRWEQWLTDPERRNSVGTGASVAAHAVVIVLLALVFKAPLRATAPQPLPARTFIAAEMPPKVAVASGQMPKTVVQQAGAGELETVAFDPRDEGIAGGPDAQSEIRDSKSEISGPKSRAPSFATQGSDAKSRADAATAPRPATAPDGPPGLSGGSGGTPDLLQAADASMQDKFTRRSPDGRSEGIHYGGGSKQSEEAVEKALGWIAVHQRADGSWSFNHITPACEHYCTNPGSESSTTAATGMALLPFLGAGYTHKKGEYQDTVKRGLDYLKRRGVQTYGFDLRDGSSMYGHAIATIALCEAYGLTGDAELKPVAQGGLDFIAYAQEPKSGGWRYNPGEPGDTTVTGWMLMALKSGQMAHLEVKSPVIFAAERFLDSVQNSDGSQYGYLDRKPGQGTTAVGLLCRMYTGWRRSNPGLIKGAAQLAKWGPSKDNMYFDYYATQVLFHHAGSEWDGWNRKMRELLIKSQARTGHPAGSWYFESQQSAAGGRLYNTAMATMILEVYYRFMPLYGEEAVK